MSMTEAPRRAIFLDRDGTLNNDTGYVHRKEDWHWLPGVVETLRRFHAVGYLLVVVSNQSGIARGMFGEDDLHALEAWINEDLAASNAVIDAWYYCPHLPEVTGPCDCRKPEPGLLLRAAADLNIDLARSWMVGDRVRDMQAGSPLAAAACCCAPPLARTRTMFPCPTASRSYRIWQPPGCTYLRPRCGPIGLPCCPPAAAAGVAPARETTAVRASSQRDGQSVRLGLIGAAKGAGRMATPSRQQKFYAAGLRAVGSGETWARETLGCARLPRPPVRRQCKNPGLTDVAQGASDWLGPLSLQNCNTNISGRKTPRRQGA